MFYVLKDSLRKLTWFEDELVELRASLRRDAASFKERRQQRQRRSKGDSSGGDSGISSDSYELEQEQLPAREQQLQRLQLLAAALQENLPPDSPALLTLTSTLTSAAQQLSDLKTSFRTVKARRRRLVGGRGRSALAAGEVRERRVVRSVVVMNLVLLLVLLVAWAVEPTCCDTYSQLAFGPQLRYINGPPPI